MSRIRPFEVSIDQIPKDDYDNDSVLVLEASPTYDFSIACSGFNIKGANGATVFIPDIGEHQLQVGDILQIYRTNKVIRGVIQDKDVWFYFKNYNSTNEVKSRLQKERVKSLDKDEYLAELQVEFEKLPKAYRGKIEFLRHAVENFSFLYEKKEVELYHQLVAVSAKIKKEQGDSYNRTIESQYSSPHYGLLNDIPVPNRTVAAGLLYDIVCKNQFQFTTRCFHNNIMEVTSSNLRKFQEFSNQPHISEKYGLTKIAMYNTMCMDLFSE